MDTAAEDGDIVHFKCPEAVITCQICMEVFESPRILPCQHTFCKKCVVSLLNKHCLDEDGNTKKTSFPCPNCRRDCKIRHHGKHSIKEHLKCFPESLLLKTILESIIETPTCEPWSKLNAEYDLPEVLNEKRREYGDKRYISSRAARVVEERLWFYFLFIRTLSTFLYRSQVYVLESVNTVRRSELVSLVQEVLKISRIIYNPNLPQWPSDEYFDTPDVDTTLQKIRALETDRDTYIDVLINTGRIDTLSKFREAQTQTDGRFSRFWRRYKIMTDKLQRFISFILIKNISIVICLYQNRLTLPPHFKILDYGLSYTIPYKRIRYWLLFFKLFDILTLIYFADHSFSWSLTLLMICYVFLLMFFKRIKHCVSSNIYVGNILPLFPTFLISLNLFTNLKRCYVYWCAFMHMDIWLLIKLSSLEFIPEVAVFVTMLVLICYRKEHLLYQYGPYVDMNIDGGVYY